MNIQSIQSPADYSRPVNTVQSRTAPADKPAAKAGGPGPASVNAAGNQVLTAEEKDFFAALFPGSENEVQSYRTYSPGGLRQSAASGTLIDRKG